MLKFTFNALIQQQLGQSLQKSVLRPLHTAEKHRPTMFHTATVKPTRSGPSILYNTPLNVLSCYICKVKYPNGQDSNGRLVAYVDIKLASPFSNSKGRWLLKLTGSKLSTGLMVKVITIYNEMTKLYVVKKK